MAPQMPAMSNRTNKPVSVSVMVPLSCRRVVSLGHRSHRARAGPSKVGIRSTRTGAGGPKAAPSKTTGPWVGNDRPFGLKPAVFHAAVRVFGRAAERGELGHAR